jgi:hypothetical protein
MVPAEPLPPSLAISKFQLLCLSCHRPLTLTPNLTLTRFYNRLRTTSPLSTNPPIH